MLLASATTRDPPPQLEIVVQAGAWPRGPGPVAVRLPPRSSAEGEVAAQPDSGAAPWRDVRSWPLWPADREGGPLWLQFTVEGDTAYLWNPWSLEAGETLRLRSRGRSGRSESASTPLTWRRTGDDWTLHDAGTPCFTYRGERQEPPSGVEATYARAGYVHPLRSPSGALLTDDFPPSHRHQRGLFFAWTRLQVGALDADFWNFPEHRDRTVPRGVEAATAGPLFAELRVRHEACAAASREGFVHAFDEQLAYRVFRAQGGVTYLDLEITHTAGEHDLTMPEYRYGGLCVRGPRTWEAGFSVLTDDGSDRPGADAGTAHWFAAWGPCEREDGTTEPAGFAAILHPDNRPDPSPMRMNPDVPQCGWAPTRRGGLSQAAHSTRRERHRLLLFDGTADPGRLAQVARDYREPVVATARWVDPP